MKQITASMYEEQALDYLEGRLSGVERVAFERYLEQNARAASDIEALRHFMPVAAAEPMAYPGMEALLRGPRLNPWRRALSLVGGAAASAVIVTCLVLIGKEIGPQERIAETTVAHPEQIPVEAPAVVETQPDLATQTIQTVPASRPSTSTDAEARPVQAGAAAKAVQSALPSVALETPAETPVTPELAESIQMEPAPIFDLPPDALKPILADFKLAQREEPLEYNGPGFDTPAYENDGLTPRTPIGSLLSHVAFIRPYATEEGRGVEIASLIRIGRRNTEPEKINN